MSKCEITISRDITINTGNYSSIKPSVSLTVSIEEDKMDVEYSRISKVLDALFGLEMINLAQEQLSITELGFKNYITTISKSEDVMKKHVTEFANESLYKIE